MSYEKLHEHFRRLGQLQEVAAIVEWDQAVNMPQKAGNSRAESMAGLARLSHELLTQPELADWIDVAMSQPDLGDWERANLREMARLYRRATALEPKLVEAVARADKQSEQAWRRYRGENDFRSYAPHLEEVVSLHRQVAQALGESLQLSPYDALVDAYEPGISSRDIDRVFEPLEASLPGLTDEVLARQASTALEMPQGPFETAAQRGLGLEMMAAVGFDLSRGRLDVSHHPFCGGTASDVRITTRYDEADFTSSLMGVLHEAGHGKYEQGLPHRWEHQPVGLARGMALHESQSLLLEMQVCRGLPFIEFAAPKIRQAFSERVARQPSAYTLDNLTALYRKVQRSLIRVDADEVTYPAHIVLRYGLERQLIDGTLAVADLPLAWDAGMQRLLQLSTLGNDKDGCLQDVHWPSGAFGYFPLYTLGAMIAAQLYAAITRAVPDVEAQIARGEFGALDEWLGQYVWSWGSCFSGAELVLRATGEPLEPRYFLDHLRRRYLPN